MSETPFLTITAAAKLAGVSRVTMWRRVRDHQLPAYRTFDSERAHIRIRRDDLEAFINADLTQENE
jgi:excisionase family DNA binding protein